MILIQAIHENRMIHPDEAEFARLNPSHDAYKEG